MMHVVNVGMHLCRWGCCRNNLRAVVFQLIVVSLVASIFGLMHRLEVFGQTVGNYSCSSSSGTSIQITLISEI